MKILDFLKEKAVFLSLNIIFFIVVMSSMVAVKTSLVMMFVVWCIWFLPLFSYMIIDYIKYKRYFSNIESVLEHLDKKYLLPEVIEEESFLVGEKFNELLRILSRDMHENVKYYRDMQEEYREYIEMWVHEIKTPIASSKLLIENNSNEVTKKIDTQIDKIENYVEQVLYYSRSDEVGKDYIIKEVKLGELIRKVIKRNHRDFINKKIVLKLDDIPEIVYCDAKWLEFILNQIIGNGIKYSKEKGSSIKVTTKELSNSVVLIIEDTGVGIIDRDVNRVFEKGFTGENGRIFGKSTGMGLYLCKKLCDKLGLGLKLESKENKGTRVSVIFPNYKL